MAKLITVFSKSLTSCIQCDMTVKELTKNDIPALTLEGLTTDTLPTALADARAGTSGLTAVVVKGIDTPELEVTLFDFKNRHKLAAAPIVIVTDEDGNELDWWAGFRPDKVREHAAELVAA